MASRGALSWFGLPSLHSRCTFSQRCNNPHSSILPLNATVNLQPCTCYTLLDTSPARERKKKKPTKTKPNLTGSASQPSPVLDHSSLYSYSVSAGYACFYDFFFFLIKMLQMLVAAFLLDCYINLKQF